ncbi:MAG TPA: hypothetical protein VJ249_04320 [Candidatus Bathyarchaeia archaeon]|nr:hypothetical protein [Candidatus Bathyarchaeia archaeon]
MQSSISLKHFLIFSLLLVVVVGAGVAAGIVWTMQRIDIHKQWASMVREGARFSNHIESASGLLPIDSELDTTRKRCLINELDYSDVSLGLLIRLDEEHEIQLMTIREMVGTLRYIAAYFSTINVSSVESLGKTIYDVGVQVNRAYSNIINYASIDGINGPPFWYSGPSPPDEAILGEAVSSAVRAQKMLPTT